MKIDRRSWLKSATLASTAAMLLPPNIALPANRPTNLTNGKLILNSNENAYGPSETVVEAIAKSVNESNRYPWQTRQLLIDKISQLEGIPADYILLGAGSSEILQLAGLAYGARGGRIVSSYPTFPLMMQHATTFEAQWTKIPLNEAYNHSLDLLGAAQHAQLLYLCNPNNPTGTMIDVATLTDFCQSIPKETVVFVDEAYIEFTRMGLNSSLAPLVASNSNLVVARTFSKIYGMAGLRVGYAYAHPDLIKQLKRYHIGFEINIPITSLYAALAACDDQNFLKVCKEQNLRAKHEVYRTFKEWDISYVDSETNFIYFKTDKFVPDLVVTLEKHQILIRDYADQPGYARVSMGTSEQMLQFLDSLKQFLT